MSRIKLYKPFQHWQEKGNIWIFSDPHFDDSDCKLMNPDWIEPKEHLKKINQSVHKQDTIVCLGDVGNPEYIKHIKARYKVLIKGNHDRGNSYYEEYFDEIYDGSVMISSQIILSHEPIYLPFAINIHGHVHNGDFQEIEDSKTVGYNLASDVADWKPFCLNHRVNGGMLHDIPTIHRLAINKHKEI